MIGGTFDKPNIEMDGSSKNRVNLTFKHIYCEDLSNTQIVMTEKKQLQDTIVNLAAFIYRKWNK